MSGTAANKDLKFHEAANIFPMDDENIDTLADDIRENDLQFPIETIGDEIIDGRRRYMACRMAGVEPSFIEVDPKDPVSYVLSLNLHRRHLSTTQKAMVAARARKMYDDAAKERQKEHGGTAPGKPKDTGGKFSTSEKARDAAGKALKVSGKTVDYATNVLKRGTPELIAAVDADKIAVSTASRHASRPPSEQRELVSRQNGKSKKPRPAEIRDPDEDIEWGELRGIGVQRAHEAIAVLKKIPKNDGLRKRGLQIVLDWIRNNK